MSQGGLIILPSSGQRRPEHGAGLDRDGPPRDLTEEQVCECFTHPPDKTRRFVAPGEVRSGQVVKPPPICPACRKANLAAYKRSVAEGVRDGNNRMRVARATSGAKPISRIVMLPDRLL